MKQNRLLTIVTLIIAALIILLAGRCRKGADSAEMEIESPKKAAEAAPEIKAITESAQTAVEERTSYIETDKLTPEEALSVSFHGQIERVVSDLYTSIGEIEQQVADFSDEEILAYADEYIAVIPYVKDKIITLTEDLQQLTPLDLAGQKGQVIQAQLAEAEEQLFILKERYQIYLDRLIRMGVNMREYGGI